MVTKKDLIIVALATFCLTSTLFIMIPIRSETPVGTYDPWIDLNEDGRINLLDAIMQGNHFLTSGDSTKNVNVTNFGQYKILHWQLNVTAGFAGWCNGYCGGYSRLAISIDATDFSEGEYRFTIWLGFLKWYNVNETMAGSQLESPVTYNVVDRSTGGWAGSTSIASIIETKGPFFELAFLTNSTQTGSWGLFDIYTYLRNE